MGQNATSLAIVRLKDNLVETFVRLDLPDGWEPPEGYYVVPNDELPENWQKVPEPRLSIPESISARQIRLWLIRKGISLSQIEMAINSIDDQLLRDSTKIEWEYAPYIERNHPMLAPLAIALGLSENDIDLGFIEASQL